MSQQVHCSRSRGRFKISSSVFYALNLALNCARRVDSDAMFRLCSSRAVAIASSQYVSSTSIRSSTSRGWRHRRNRALYDASAPPLSTSERVRRQTRTTDVVRGVRAAIAAAVPALRHGEEQHPGVPGPEREHKSDHRQRPSGVVVTIASLRSLRKQPNGSIRSNSTSSMLRP